MNYLKTITMLAMLCIANIAHTQSDSTAAQVPIPPKPEPWQFVSDFAGVLSEAEAAQLNQQLSSFADSARFRIVVATMPNLGDTPIQRFAAALGDVWGVWQGEAPNGAVLMIKPKLDEDDTGNVYIATGYNTVGALTYARCTQVTDEIIIPYLSRNDYASGIAAGCHAIMNLVYGRAPGDIAQREQTEKEKDEEETNELIKYAIICACIWFLVVFFITLNEGIEQKRRLFPWIIWASILNVFVFIFKGLKTLLLVGKHESHELPKSE